MADEIQVIGEVIESSTTEFMAESRELHSPPPFGSFVKVELSGVEVPVPNTVDDDDPFDSFRQAAGSFNSGYHATVSGESVEDGRAVVIPATYAIVYQATTTPVDTGRKLRAYWKDEEQLKEEQPELSEWMLVTNFKAVIIGHCMNGTMCQFLPPQPPKLLTRVNPCTAKEIHALTSRMDFLRTLSNFSNAPTEEVVAACIREAYVARGEDYDFLVRAGKELAGLMKDDYDRLLAVMRRISP